MRTAHPRDGGTRRRDDFAVAHADSDGPHVPCRANAALVKVERVDERHSLVVGGNDTAPSDDRRRAGMRLDEPPVTCPVAENAAPLPARHRTRGRSVVTAPGRNGGDDDGENRNATHARDSRAGA